MCGRLDRYSTPALAIYTNSPVRYGGLDCKKLSMLFKSVVLI